LWHDRADGINQNAQRAALAVVAAPLLKHQYRLASRTLPAIAAGTIRRHFGLAIARRLVFAGSPILYIEGCGVPRRIMT
jgi:hypothetical protein